MNARNAGEALALALCDEFARAGVMDACISPGSRSTPLALALVNHARIRTHVVIDERSAAFVALGIGKASRQPALVLCTSGTAAANLHPAVIEAHESRVPLIVLTADRPPELRATGANQTTDQIKLFGDAVRWFCEVGVAEVNAQAPRYWRSLASRAWGSAVGSPPGPVHLNIAFRDPLVPIQDGWDVDLAVEGRPDGRPWTRVEAPPRIPAERDVERLASVVERTERGVLVAGAGDVEAGPVLEFAKACGWPLLAEPTSGLRSGENAISTYDALLRVESFAAGHPPDFVLRIGKPGLSKATMAWLPPEIDQVLVDPDGAWLDPERTMVELIACDPAALCGEVAKAITPRSSSDWLSSWKGAEVKARSVLDAALDSEVEPSEPRAARDLAAAAVEGSILSVAASMPIRDVDWFMAPRSGIRVLANRGANGIDGVVSTAVGESLVSEGPVYALMGDLALIHDSNGLLAARDESLDLVIVAINNDGGGIFSFLPQAAYPEHFERLFGTPHGMDPAALASAYGCGHARLERADDLIGLVEEARAAEGTAIVEVPTDRSANVVLHQRLWAEVAAALG